MHPSDGSGRDRPLVGGDLYDAVTRHAAEVSAKARRDAKIAKLIAKLTEN
jgi:hypothetical protein